MGASGYPPGGCGGDPWGPARWWWCIDAGPGMPGAVHFWHPGTPGRSLGSPLGHRAIHWGIPAESPPGIPRGSPVVSPMGIPRPPPSRPRVVVVYRYWVLWDLVASLPLGDILIRNCPQMLLKCMPNATFGLRKIYQNSPFWLSPTAFDPGFEGGVFEKPGVLFLGPADEIGSDSGTHKGLIGSGASWSTRLRGSSEA